MKRSEAIREVWELLESNPSGDSVTLSNKIVDLVDSLGFSPPEITRVIKLDELTEFVSSGYDNISEEDLIMVKEYESEDYPDKSKLS